MEVKASHSIPGVVPRKPATPTLLQNLGHVVHDVFTPGHKGERALIHSVRDVQRQLKILPPAFDAQAHSQDALSQTERAGRSLRTRAGKAVREAGAAVDQTFKTARDFYRDEAKTARGGWRAAVGTCQSLAMVGEGLYSSGKFFTKLGVNSALATYHTLKGDVNLLDAAAQGAKKTLAVAEGGCRYVASGRLGEDVKKFSKGLGDYKDRVVNDPTLELPKAATLLTCAFLFGRFGKLAPLAEEAAAAEVAVSSAPGLGRAAAVVEEAAAVRPPVGGIVPRNLGVSSRVAAVTEEAAAVRQPLGDIVPRNFGARSGAAATPGKALPPSLPRPSAPVNAEMQNNLQKALRLVEESRTAPAPVQLPPSNLPLPTKTPVCLPSANYAPVAPRGYLKPLELLESCLDIVG